MARVGPKRHTGGGDSQNKQALKIIWAKSIENAGGQIACLSFCPLQPNFSLVEMFREVKQTERSHACLSLPFFAPHLEVQPLRRQQL